jgi:hypothetical protein
MTHTRFVAVSALLAIASVAACSAAPGSGAAPAAAAAPAANPTKAAQAAAPAAAPAASPAAVALNAGTFSGAVTETMNSGGYSYMKLRGGKDGREDLWVAAAEFAVTTGERVSVSLDMPMENFHSKTLNRDFPVLYFVSNVAREGEPLAGARGPAAGPAAPIGMMGSHQSAAAATTPVERIPPASGGLTIADVWAQRKALAGKPVVVRGKVVKVNNGIMDRNWIHLQDGSGTAADRTNDLTITTAAEVKLGDIVTVSGVLAIGKDFGAGYAYDAILENAKVTGK